ncbi:hypothetical protein [Roseomonas sp. BN140053]|uniref:hypothetical protein n=1 Tax=Roseomonas sp. BN140053 TaxID=3391898 RepID=UPI0039ED88B0
MNNYAPPATLTPYLCRQARTLLEWDEGELAFIARLQVSDLQEFERDTRLLSKPVLAFLRTALERAGVEFTPDAGSRGVRLAAGKSWSRMADDAEGE